MNWYTKLTAYLKKVCNAYAVAECHNPKCRADLGIDFYQSADTSNGAGGVKKDERGHGAGSNIDVPQQYGFNPDLMNKPVQRVVQCPKCGMTYEATFTGTGSIDPSVLNPISPEEFEELKASGVHQALAVA